MTLRTFVVATFLIIAFIFNTFMLVAEEVIPPAQKKEITVAQGDSLANLRYSAGTRIANFKAYGLPDDMASEANARAVRIDKDRRPILEKVVKETSEVSTRVFCPGSRLPQRYSALQVLVTDDGSGRRVTPPDEVISLAPADWFAQAQVQDVFEDLEMVTNRHPDATVMGVAAILLSAEDKVINGDGPWGDGTLTSPWGFNRMLDEYQDRKIRGKLVEYFAMMHLLTEIANSEKGVCS